MHFVINVFVTAVCFISLILFKEILNKIVKVLLSVIGCGTLSYALAILNKEQTQNYVKTINDMKKKIDIYFQKVLAHSGDYYNEVADSLAKKAVGIKK